MHGSTSFGGEPTIQIAKDGTIWVTDLQPEGIMKSTDKGATWTFITPPLSQFGGGDMDGAPDAAGRVHVFDLQDRGNGLNCIFYYRSSDGGSSFDLVQATQGGGVWLPGDGGCGSTSGHNVDRPWTATFGNTLYMLERDLQTHSAGLNMSTDGGRTFSFTTVPNFTDPDGFAIDPVDGSIYIVGQNLANFSPTLGRNAGTAVVYATSTDGKAFTMGTIFTAPAGVDTNQSPFARIAVDAAHNVYATWSDNSAGTVDVYLSVSRDRAKTWSKPIRVTSGFTVASYPTITAGDAGRMAIAYYATSDPAKAINDAKGASWNVFVALSVNATDATPSFETVKVTPQPFHHNSLCKPTNICEGVDAQMGPPADYERGVLDFFSMTMDTSGALNLIWTDTTAGFPEDFFARQSAGNLLKASSVQVAAGR